MSKPETCPFTNVTEVRVQACQTCPNQVMCVNKCKLVMSKVWVTREEVSQSQVNTKAVRSGQSSQVRSGLARSGHGSSIQFVRAGSVQSGSRLHASG